MTDTEKRAITTVVDAHRSILESIATLKAAGIAVPISLHKAAHALAYAVDEKRKS